MKKKIDFYLIGIICIAIFVNFYGIWNDATVNPYYTAAVTSMVQNFHNFFYASFDPAGFITVDKPPVAFWFQAISAKLFGVHGWSVILPQALAGVCSVIILYFLIRPRFGKWAARISALILALTPIAVAVSRTNNVDAILVFFLMLGTLFLFKAVKRGKLGWLLLAFVMIGVGFNVKMLQAYMVLPAFVVFYLLATNISWKKKAVHLALSLVLMLGVSVSWAVIVDQTSASSRPYIGSSQTNSVLELAFGYNGMERLLGQETGTGTSGGGPSSSVYGMQGGAPGGQNDGSQSFGGGSSTGMPSPPSGQGSGGQGGSKMMGSSGMFGTGEKGPLRLFQTALGDQISWFLPLALFGIIAIFIAYRRENEKWFHLSDAQKEMVFWTAWLIPVAGFFSVAGFFHHYYLIMLAPPIAALAGAGLVALFKLYREKKNWQSFLLPSAITLTGLLQAFFVFQYTVPFAIGIALLSAAISLFLVLYRHESKGLTAKITALGLAILLAAPTYWSLTPLIYGGNSSLPEAGPQLASSSGGGFADASVDTGLIAYLEKNNTGETYLFGTTDATTAGPYIIKTQKAVMAMGGFNGTDPTLSVSELKTMIKNGEIKYFYIPSNSKAADSDVIKWIEENGTAIDSSEYSSETDTNSSATTSNFGTQGMNGTGNGTLYLLK